MQGCVGGITGFTLKAQHDTSTKPAPQVTRTKRITAEDVTKERVDAMTARDPLLDAAVRALDLELRD